MTYIQSCISLTKRIKFKILVAFFRTYISIYILAFLRFAPSDEPKYGLRSQHTVHLLEYADSLYIYGKCPFVVDKSQSLAVQKRARKPLPCTVRQRNIKMPNVWVRVPGVYQMQLIPTFILRLKHAKCTKATDTDLNTETASAIKLKIYANSVI